METSPVPSIPTPTPQQPAPSVLPVLVGAREPLAAPEPHLDDRLQIQVGRLVLDGFNLPPGGDRQVQAAFEAELATLFSAGDLPALLRCGGARRSLPGGGLSISSWQDPDDLGRQIARAVVDGMRS